MLGSLSYQSVLRRGFALVRDAHGQAVRSVAGLSSGARVGIEFADGLADATIASAVPSADAGEAKADARGRDERTSTPRAPTRRGPSGQGSLF
jgi:exodeoxyribonuclease VII large subunit